MKILKLLPVALLVGAMMNPGAGLYGQSTDEGTPGDETAGTDTQTPMGFGRGFGMRGLGFQGFIDEDGNGLNDYLEDTDGDGLVNAHDPDSPLYRGEAGSGLGRGLGFIDEDGNGINDNLEDSDGDGVINAHDPDSPLYRAPGTRMGFGRGLGFVDEDGNGINDNLEDSDGDGVINAHDPDSPLYRAPGTRMGFGRGLGFVDENGDGLNDRLEDSDGDGVINAHDPDSPLYRNPGVRGVTRGGQGRVGMQRGSVGSGRFGASGRSRSGSRLNQADNPAGGNNR